MAFLFDIIVIAIMVICILVSRNKGFVRVILELTGGIGAAIAAHFLSKPFGAWISSKFIQPIFVNMVSKNLVDISGKTVEKNALQQIKSFDLSKIISDAPTALQELLNRFNIDMTYLQNISDAKAGTSTAVHSQTVVETIASPISNAISAAIAFTILFAIFMAVVMVLAKLASMISYIPVVGKANQWLGALLGIFKGIVFIVVFSALVQIIIPYLAQPMHLNKENPYQYTLFYRHIAEHNPISNILSPGVN